MAVKVFILGRPGSGKSSAARIIANHVRNKAWKCQRINDYAILHEMFLADTKPRQFEPIEYNSFDISDLSVLDVALREVEKQAHPWCSGKKSMVIMEFARDDYHQALQCFQRPFLQDAYFLFIEADIETCIERVKKRVTYTYIDPRLADNHYVSEDILRTYYAKNNTQYIRSRLRTDFGIIKRIEVIENIYGWREFATRVGDFIDFILWQEYFFKRFTS